MRKLERIDTTINNRKQAENENSEMFAPSDSD